MNLQNVQKVINHLSFFRFATVIPFREKCRASVLWWNDYRNIHNINDVTTADTGLRFKIWLQSRSREGFSYL